MYTEKTVTEKKVAEVHEEAEQRMLRLNMVLVGWCLADKLMRSLVTE